MADGAEAYNDKEAGQRMQALSLAFRHVGAPLLSALMETGGQNPEKKTAPGFDAFPLLIDSVANLARQMATQVDSGGGSGLRLGAAVAASQLVAANYRATGHAPAAEDMAPVLAVLDALPEKIKSLYSDDQTPNQAMSFRARMMEAMVPVIGAIAQYSFGRGEHGLLAEVAERLVKTADKITRTLAVPGSTPAQWRVLCWSILRASGQIYADSHYAEADRLLYMNPDERAAYFAQHGNIVPVTAVWQEFNQRMALLATLGAYLDLPGAADMESEGWD